MALHQFWWGFLCSYFIDKCIMDVLPICVLPFRQTEGILENTALLSN